MTGRCAKCGCGTKGEVAWIENSEWCHPCADQRDGESSYREAVEAVWESPLDDRP